MRVATTLKKLNIGEREREGEAGRHIRRQEARRGELESNISSRSFSKNIKFPSKLGKKEFIAFDYAKHEWSFNSYFFFYSLES
jgi:hypothetical protein